jgi:hypothetical protein
MDRLAEFIGLVKLNRLKRNQLVIQTVADKYLEQVKPVCPGAVADLLLSIRKQSRIDQLGIVNAKLTDTFEAVESEISKSLEIYGKITNIGASCGSDSDKCIRLDWLAKEVNNN